MEDRFFAQPVLNAPYSYPARHWELDDDGQPTQQHHRAAAQRRVHHPHPQAPAVPGGE